MLGAGLEPARPEEQGILSPLCLPFHHPSKLLAMILLIKLELDQVN